MPPLKPKMEFANVLGTQLGTFMACDESNLYCEVDKSVKFQVEIDVTKPFKRGIRIISKESLFWVRKTIKLLLWMWVLGLCFKRL